MKYSDLIVLSYRSQINLVGHYGRIIPQDKNDIDHTRYISQGLEIDLDKKLYRTIFGADHRNNYIKNGFNIIDGWNQIGQSIIYSWGDHGDGLLGVYDRTNIRHLRTMVYDVVEANTHYSNLDD